MKLTPILYMSAAMLMLLSCGNTSTNDNHEDSLWTSPAVSNEIIDLGTIERSDTFTLRGKVYRYEFRLASVDSLPIIVNSDGTRYYDNDVTLTVRHDSTVVLRRPMYQQTRCATPRWSVLVSTSPMPTTTTTCGSSLPSAIPTRRQASIIPLKCAWHPTEPIRFIPPKILKPNHSLRESTKTLLTISAYNNNPSHGLSS